MSCSTVSEPLSIFTKKAIRVFEAALQNARSTRQATILSIPLAFGVTPEKAHAWLQKQPSPPYMLIEQPSQDKTYLHWGVTQAFRAQGKDRFKDGHAWFEQLQKKVFHTPEVPFHIYCAFTFQDYYEADEQTFPPAHYVLPEFSTIKSVNSELTLYNTSITEETTLEAIAHKVEQIIIAIKNYKPDSSDTLSKVYLLQETSKAHYKDMVTKAIGTIRNHIYQKIALARTVTATKEDSLAFDILKTLENLRKAYPQCSLVHLNSGDGTQYLAATPEHLLSIDEQKLYTESIAGSIKRGETEEEDDILAKQLMRCSKNRLEHQWVIDEINQNLTQLGLSAEIGETQVIKLHNIQHLKTLIKAALTPSIHPLMVTEALHPTCAVGGLPKHQAMKEISRLEPFVRGLYGGTLGWIDSLGNAEMLVGIRCATIRDNQATLYTGCGIVETSIPEDELQETEDKVKALALNLA